MKHENSINIKISELYSYNKTKKLPDNSQTAFGY